MTGALKRFDDWPTRLDAFIQSRTEYAFSWGSQDCCLFACDAVLEMTGTDLAKDFRGTYNAAAGALAAIRELKEATVGGLADSIARANGIAEVPISFAQRGDVVYVLLDDRDSLGIVSLSGDAIWTPGEFGLVQNQLSIAIKAWRI